MENNSKYILKLSTIKGNIICERHFESYEDIVFNNGMLLSILNLITEEMNTQKKELINFRKYGNSEQPMVINFSFFSLSYNNTLKPKMVKTLICNQELYIGDYDKILRFNVNLKPVIKEIIQVLRNN